MSGRDELEYAVGTRLSRPRPLSAEERRRLREEYGWLRTYFKTRRARYADLQRSLNQARMGEVYDEYMTRTAQYAILMSVLGVLVGVLISLYLSRLGVFSSIRAPTQIRGSLTAYLADNSLLFGGVAVTVLSTTILGGGTWLARYYYPSTKVVTRRQSIDVTLPHAIVFMYALSYGGMSLTDSMRRLAEADDTYGEVAKEFDQLIRDVDLFGNDLVTAIENTRNLTPSDNLEQFLDDLLSVLDAGGDVTVFLENEAGTYLEEAKDEQEDFLETLSIMSEVFITGFVAAPLFVIVILVVISLLGGRTLLQIGLLVYAVLPLGMAGFLVLIDTLAEPFTQSGSAVSERRERADPVDVDRIADDSRLGAYRRHLRVERFKGFLRDPLRQFRRRPATTLVVSVPVAAAAVAGLVLTDTVTPTYAALIDRPVLVTTGLVVVPFLAIAVPLSYYFERKSRRERRLARRFPDTLNILSSANKMGIDLVDGLDLVSRSSTGPVSREIRNVRNDIVWNADVRGALLSFARRLEVPQLTRTLRLIAEGIGSSGDLSRVLSIAADDARNRYRLERARLRELTSYTAIVVIGFLVYLLVVLMLDTSYLQPIAELQSEGTVDVGPGAPTSFANVRIEIYQLVFFHSALVQGVGSGLLAGKLAENSVWSGLKYAIALVVISLAAFALV